MSGNNIVTIRSSSQPAQEPDKTIPKSAAVIFQVYSVFESSKDHFFKAIMYVVLFICWVYQRQHKQQKAHSLFNIYQKLFYYRRIYRLGCSISFVPAIKKDFAELEHHNFSFKQLAKLSNHLGRAFFYAFDNIAIILNIIGNKKYKILRRTAFSLLLVSLLGALAQCLSSLRETFKREHDLKKKMLAGMTPKIFMIELNKIDEERMNIAVDFAMRFGDVLPTLQRINIPQAVFRTRINKLNVSFFGMIAVVLEILQAVRHKNGTLTL